MKKLDEKIKHHPLQGICETGCHNYIYIEKYNLAMCTKCGAFIDVDLALNNFRK